MELNVLSDEVIDFVRKITYQLTKGLRKDDRDGIYHEVIIYLLENNIISPTMEQVSYAARYSRSKTFSALKKSRRAQPLECISCECESCENCPEALPPSLDPTESIVNQLDAANAVQQLENTIIDNFSPKRARTALMICKQLSKGHSQRQVANRLGLDYRTVKLYVHQIRALFPAGLSF